jgi:hypothetical protein
MAQRQLNIRSDEAHERATRLARRTGRTATEVVVDALRSYEQASGGERHGLSPDQQREHEEFMALVRGLQKHVLPGATSNHDDLYDDHGLPR